MTAEERTDFLRSERTCRVATVGADGSPHVSALWFVWDGTALWLNSIVKSQRWTDLMRDPHVAIIVDTGDGFGELRGLELHGSVQVVGDVPRTDVFDAALVQPELLFGQKYGGGQFSHDGRHAWLRLVPDKFVSWDFRKLR